MSLKQLMIFSNAVLERLWIKRASLKDNLYYKYVGCDDEEESISLIEIYAIFGKTQGFYESFGFMRPFGYRRQESMTLENMMKRIHDTMIRATINLGDGSILDLSDKDYKMCELMVYYWERDQCQFSKLYKALKAQGMFRIIEEAEKHSNQHREKIFVVNANKPNVMFHDTVS